MRIYNHKVPQCYYPAGSNFKDIREDFIKITKYFFENINPEEIRNKNINLFCIGSSGVITASVFAGYAIEHYSHMFSSIIIIDLKKELESID